jgi:predicted RNA binding protein YcfA (HicA-like mRNA interferase family)
MPKIPSISGEKLIKILHKKGFLLDRITGSHHILIHLQKKLTLSIPVHKGRILGKGITHAILKDAGINTDEFIKLLRKKS